MCHYKTAVVELRIILMRSRLLLALSPRNKQLSGQQLSVPRACFLAFYFFRISRQYFKARS